MRSKEKVSKEKVTIIGKGCVIEDNTISSNNPITIDGNFYGTVKSSSEVYIGIDGYVNGDIDGSNVSIAGKFEGNIDADNVCIEHTGIVKGDVHTKLITIDEGGVLNGKVDMNANERGATIIREEELNV